MCKGSVYGLQGGCPLGESGVYGTRIICDISYHMIISYCNKVSPSSMIQEDVVWGPGLDDIVP